MRMAKKKVNRKKFKKKRRMMRTKLKAPKTKSASLFGKEFKRKRVLRDGESLMSGAKMKQRDC